MSDFYKKILENNKEWVEEQERRGGHRSELDTAAPVKQTYKPAPSTIFYSLFRCNADNDAILSQFQLLFQYPTLTRLLLALHRP